MALQTSSKNFILGFLGLMFVAVLTAVLSIAAYHAPLVVVALLVLGKVALLGIAAVKHVDPNDDTDLF